MVYLAFQVYTIFGVLSIEKTAFFIPNIFYLSPIYTYGMAELLHIFLKNMRCQIGTSKSGVCHYFFYNLKSRLFYDIIMSNYGETL